MAEEKQKKIATTEVEKKKKVGNKKPAITETQKKQKVHKLSDSVDSSVSVEPGGVKIDVYGRDGKVVGSVNLPKEIFDAKVNNSLMAQAVRVYLTNQRSGTAHTKTRGEVKGSTRKIYRQKGTGRARHGAITAPIFVGGGIAFGPRKRDISLALPKKMRRKALFSALTLKFKSKSVKILEELDNIDSKTKNMQNILKSLNLLNKKGKADKVLFVSSKNKENVERAIRNIGGISLKQAKDINTYSILNSKNIVFMKNSIETLSETFLNSTPVQSDSEKE
ncbi:50S ribosomal protein L4 [Candidatus Parcubacteria bacterium]|nr:MAG: 50S ribosomal protein L4 [Candidatus Parcubacteria bacterium]